MKKIINKNLIKINKTKLIISSVFMTLVMFFIMGNHSMIGIGSKEINEEVGRIIFNKCFSLSYFRMFILFISCSGIFIIFSKNKSNELMEIVNKKSLKLEYIIKNAILINTPIILSILINAFIKFILYYVNSGLFADVLEIKLSIVFIFFIYNIVVALIFYSIILLFNIAIKDSFMACIIPLFTFDGFILIFGISTLFISDKLSALKNIMEPISTAIVRLLDLLYFNIRFESQEIGIQIIILSVLIAIAILIIYISYVMLGIIKPKDLKRPYIFESFRYIFYIVISILIGFYGTSAIGFLLLFLGTEYTFTQGALYINMISLVSIVAIYTLLEAIYRYKLKHVYKIISEETGDNSFNENNIEENDIIDEEKEELLDKMKDFFSDSKKNNNENEVEVNSKVIDISETAIINTEEIKDKLSHVDKKLELDEYDEDSEIIKNFTNEITESNNGIKAYQYSHNDIEKYFTLSILNNNLNDDSSFKDKDKYYQISFEDIQWNKDDDNTKDENKIDFSIDESNQFNFFSMLEDESK